MVDATANTPQTTNQPGKQSFAGLAFLDSLSQMPALRQIALLVGLAASVAIGFAASKSKTKEKRVYNYS